MNTLEDVKSPIETQQKFEQDTEAQMQSLLGYKNLPMKTGEVFRNNTGQYSFMCFHCGLIFEDFGEIIGHCESHYQDEKYDVDVHTSEFVLCEEICEPESVTSSSTKPLSIEPQSEPNVSVNSKATVRTGRKRKKLNRSLSRHPSECDSRKGEEYFLPNIPQNCPMCDLWCNDFRLHMKDVHNVTHRVIQCYMCKHFFRTGALLKSHMSRWNHITNHCYQCEMEPPIKHPSEPRRHKCQFCKEWFPNHVEFKVHFKDAHNQDADFFFHKRANCNIFTCHICEREFPLRYYLTAHMKIHYDKFLQHQCPTCGKRVRTYGQLTQHLKRHEGKVFPCDQCDKQFAYYARLRLHLRSHATELKHKCDVCGKAFKQRKYLKTHEAIHKNDRKYRCKFCDASFNFTSGRRAHEKGQHGAL